MNKEVKIVVTTETGSYTISGTIGSYADVTDSTGHVLAQTTRMTSAWTKRQISMPS